MKDFFELIFSANQKRRLERNLFFKLALGCLGTCCLTGFCLLALILWFFVPTTGP